MFFDSTLELRCWLRRFTGFVGFASFVGLAELVLAPLPPRFSEEPAAGPPPRFSEEPAAVGYYALVGGPPSKSDEPLLALGLVPPPRLRDEPLLAF